MYFIPATFNNKCRTGAFNDYFSTRPLTRIQLTKLVSSKTIKKEFWMCKCGYRYASFVPIDRFRSHRLSEQIIHITNEIKVTIEILIESNEESAQSNVCQ